MTSFIAAENAASFSFVTGAGAFTGFKTGVALTFFCLLNYEQTLGYPFISGLENLNIRRGARDFKV